MASFLDVAKNVTSTRGRAVVADILSNSKMITALHLSNAFELDKTVANFIPVALGNVLQTRATGSSFTYSYTAPGTAQSVTQAITGAVVQIDRTYYRDAALTGGDITRWFETTLKRTVQGYAKELDEKLFNGTGTSGAVKGLKAILNGTDDIPGFTDKKGVVNAALYSTTSNAKYMDLRQSETTFEKEAYAFREMLLQNLALLENPQYIVMNNVTWARVQSIATKLGLLGAPTNEFFKTPTLLNLQPIVLNTTAITNTEPDDTTPTAQNITTSIYILGPAEFNLSIVTNGFDYVEFDYLEAKEAGEEKWEFGVAWKIENPASVLRIRNIRV